MFLSLKELKEVIVRIFKDINIARIIIRNI